MKWRFSSHLAVFGAAYTIGMLTLVATDADAAYRRIGPQFCHGTLPSQNVFQGDYLRNDDSVEIYAVCAAPDDSTLDHTAVTWINFHGYQQPGSFAGYATACAKYWNGWGSACGAFTYFPNYTFNVQLSPSAWQANPGHMPYILAGLSVGSRIHAASYGN